ncbi:MAG: extensin-like domain-containing protein, partial [Caulobacteraceae bacterium]
LAGLMLLVILGGLAFVFADQVVPPQHLFWKGLHLKDPIGAATKPKVIKAGPDPQACRAILSEGGVFYQDVADQPMQGFCGLSSALVLTGGVAPLKPSGAVMTCQNALAYALWMRQVVVPAAEEILGARVVSIQHYGTYSCRRIYGQKATPLTLPGPLAIPEPPASEHATANALDVAGFVLDDGRVIWVEKEWNTIGLQSHFLHRVRDGACRVFRTTLSPDYNAAHANHLHLDMGGRPLCA